MKKFNNFILEDTSAIGPFMNRSNRKDYLENLSELDCIKMFKLTTMFDTVMSGKELEVTNLIYRGVANKNFHNYTKTTNYTYYNLVDPTKIDRYSPYSDNNLYNLYLSNSRKWTKFAKRDNSLICGDYECIIQDRDEENVCVVIPFDYDISVCPREDIWYSFNYRNTHKTLNAIFANIDRYIRYKKKFDNDKNDVHWDRNWETFKTLINDLGYQDKVDFIEKYCAELGLSVTSLQEKSFLEILDILLDPKRNGFKVMKYDGSKNLPNNREIWLDSKSLLIQKDSFEYFIDKVKDFYL
jgi:hypothetical protein